MRKEKGDLESLLSLWLSQWGVMDCEGEAIRLRSLWLLRDETEFYEQGLVAAVAYDQKLREIEYLRAQFDTSVHLEVT